MDSRIITIVSTETNSRYEINSTAETLRELKQDMTNNNIPFNDLTFYEGLTKTEFLSDDSILPKDVVRNGQTTNNLVFLLTKGNKKIASGVDRKFLYSKIKELGISEEIKQTFGKNYTNVSTEDLKNYINGYTENTMESKEEPFYEDSVLYKLIKLLQSKGILEATEVRQLTGEKSTTNYLYSSEDIETMMKDLGL